MVQVVENWAFLEGVVLSVRPSDARDDLVAVNLLVDRVEGDEMFPNLFEGDVETTVSVVIPETTVQSLGVRSGVRLRCRARKASPFTAFADPTDVTVVPESIPEDEPA